MKKKLTLRERFEDNYTAVPVPCNNKKGYKMQYIYYAEKRICCSCAAS